MAAVTEPDEASDPLLVAAVGRRLEVVRNRIADAGGDPERVRIVAVTKRQPPEVALAAMAAGVVDLGENYASELLAKAEVLAGSDPLRWHLIGAVQRRRVRALAGVVALWQTVAREEEVVEIARFAPGAQVLVEVELTGLPGRNGVGAEQVRPLAAKVVDAGLDLLGLMTVAPPGDPRAARACFERCASLADSLGLRERSMGMSDDLELAVRAGSTMVRVGRALLGPRPTGAVA